MQKCSRRCVRPTGCMVGRAASPQTSDWCGVAFSAYSHHHASSPPLFPLTNLIYLPEKSAGCAKVQQPSAFDPQAARLDPQHRHRPRSGAGSLSRPTAITMPPAARFSLSLIYLPEKSAGCAQVQQTVRSTHRLHAWTCSIATDLGLVRGRFPGLQPSPSLQPPAFPSH